MASLPDEYDRMLYANEARNVEFSLNEQIETRRGFGIAFSAAVSGAITSMYNWIQAGFNKLVYYVANSGAIAIRNLETGAGTTSLIAGPAPQFIDVLSIGEHVVISRVGPDGLGQTGAKETKDGISFYDLFPAPLPGLVSALTEPSGGNVTAGLHVIGVVFTSASGYETRPSPVFNPSPQSGSIGDFAGLSFTATGGFTAQINVTFPSGSWPADFVSAALVMAPVINQSRLFFVPGCVATVPSGSAGTVPIVFPEFDISDIILTSSSSTELVTAQRDYFGLYSIGVGVGNDGPPFFPFKSLAYSNRIVYFTQLSDGTSALFISDQQTTQWITLANHLLQLPGKQQITTGFVLRGTLYILGPNWTYAVSDNNSLPVTWVPPQQVDGRIGTQSAFGIDVNSSLGYAWVAHTTGLYLFSGGYYADRPVTYLIQPDWEQINWGHSVLTGTTATRGQIRVKDFPEAKMVLVMAPINSPFSTVETANKMWAIDYSQGATWDKVNISRWDIGTGYAGLSLDEFTPSSLEHVLNPTKRVYEMWVGNGEASVWRSKSIGAGDASLHTDTSSSDRVTELGIPCVYTSCPLPKAMREPVQFTAVSPRVTGAGTINQTGLTFDETRSVSMSPITALTLTPGRWPLTFFDMQSECMHLKLDNGASAAAWFNFAGVKIWWTKWMLQK